MWRREWDSNPRMLAHRRFSRPVPSTARTSLHGGSCPLPEHLWYDTIFQPALSTAFVNSTAQKKNKKMKFGVAFFNAACYYIQADCWRRSRNEITGCSAVGSALDWGSRGREFKSRHSDHLMIIRTTFSKWGMCSDLSFLSKISFEKGTGRRKFLPVPCVYLCD